MMPRAGLLIALAAALCMALAAAGFLAWQLRHRYEQQLIQQVWPSGEGGPEISAAANSPDQPTLLLLGDSRVAQWSLPVPPTGRIVNAGLSGATTARILLTADDFLQRYRPDVVVIQAGINDLKLAGMRPDLRPSLVQTAADHLAALVGRCRSQGAKVLLLLTWPASEPDWMRRPVWNAVAVATAVEELNERLCALADPRNDVEVIDLLAEAHARPVYRDTLHLAPKTYLLLTQALERRVLELRAGR